jgi:hypothetical protein
MKTRIRSNSRSLCRALCALLLGIAALWGILGGHTKELYLSQGGYGRVGKYDATTGAAIKADFITGVDFANGGRRLG